MSDQIFSTVNDVRRQTKLRGHEQTAWITLFKMAELCNAGMQNSAPHLKTLVIRREHE